MSGRTITLHVFCSAKGGVGKSTLAAASARLLADASRTVVLLDADLTGTSLADALRLCAPEVARRPDGRLDFDAPPTGRHLTRAATLAQRNARRDAGAWEDQPPAPPYLNDVLIYENEDSAECRVDALLWKHENPADQVLYLPSSPFQTDVSIALGWLYREEPFTWLQRLMWLLDAMSEQMATLRDVVVDLPPGLFGFAHEALALLSNLEGKTAFPSGFPAWNQGGITWKGNPLLVTTLDRNDLTLALEYRIARRPQLPHLEIVLNRYAENRESELREFIHAQFGDVIGAETLIPPSSRISELGPLREIFTRQELRLNDDVRKLRAALRLEEAP